MAVIEIEVDHVQKRNMAFTPTQSVVRGRLDFLRGDKALRGKADDWPGGVPGQVIGFDTDSATGYIAEPLHDPEHAATRAKIEAMGQSLPDRRKTYGGPGEPGYDHAATWLHWMKRAVDSGHAKIVKGKLPAKIDGKPRSNFVTQDPQRFRGTAAAANALLIAMLTPEQRQRFDAAMAGTR
jgi:hypothetical protein